MELHKTNLVIGEGLSIRDIALIAKEKIDIEKREKDKEDKPKHFQEAWNHPEMSKQQKWREAIKKELGSMIKLGVWRVMNKRDIPNR